MIMQIMFDFESPLFWYKMVFMTELLVAWGVFACRLKFREKFLLRLLFGATACFSVAFLFPIFTYNAWYTSLMFFCLFAVSVPTVKFCFDEPWVNILFCGIAAYTTQHSAYEVFNLAMAVSGFDQGMAIGMYGYAMLPNINIFTVIFYMDSYVIVYALAYFLFARRINKYQDLKVNNVSFMLLAAAIVLVDILLNAIVIYNSQVLYDKIYLTVSYIYNILCCIFAISIQFGLLFRKKIQHELETVQRMLHEGQSQYELSKENIDLINLKCHDLKHQIRLIGKSDSLKAGTIAEIEDAISIYDSGVKTENEALDIILTEKSLRCRKHNIKLTCIADGKCLNFMGVADIYTLFGNAIDNAVEAVIKLDDPDKRFVRLKLSAKNRMVSVRLENWFDGQLEFAGSLPLTTKEKNGYHGYGMKSMKFITEKYGGDLSVRVVGHLFVVEMLLPIPADA